MGGGARGQWQVCHSAPGSQALPGVGVCRRSKLLKAEPAASLKREGRGGADRNKVAPSAVCASACTAAHTAPPKIRDLHTPYVCHVAGGSQHTPPGIHRRAAAWSSHGAVCPRHASAAGATHRPCGHSQHQVCTTCPRANKGSSTPGPEQTQQWLRCWASWTGSPETVTTAAGPAMTCTHEKQGSLVGTKAPLADQP